MSENLSSVASKGAVVLGAVQVAKLLVSVVSTTLLARLLSPRDFGVIAMVSPVLGFVGILSELGLGQAVVQSKQIEPRQIDTIFWWNVGGSVVLALVVLALAPAAAAFYGNHDVLLATALFSISVLINGFGLAHVSLLNREMRFGGIALADLANAVVTLLAALSFAVWLRDFRAIVLGPVCGMMASVLVLWTANRWRPQLRFDLAGSRTLLGFGLNVVGFNVVNFFGRNMDNVLIAKAWGPVQLGLYDRCYRLMTFPLQSINGPLSQVVLPSLARTRDRPEQYRRIYLNALNALTIFVVPAIVAVAVCSADVIAMLLGPRWSAAAPIFFWLSLAAILQPIGNSTGWLFLSSGRARAMMHWGLVSTGTTIAGFIVGLPYGAVGVAASYFLVALLRMPIMLAWCTRGTPVRFGDTVRALLVPSCALAVTWLAMHDHFTTLAPFWRAALAGVLSYLVSFAVALTSADGRAMLRKSATIVGDLLRPLLRPAAA